MVQVVLSEDPHALLAQLGVCSGDMLWVLVDAATPLPAPSSNAAAPAAPAQPPPPAPASAAANDPSTSTSSKRQCVPPAAAAASSGPGAPSAVASAPAPAAGATPMDCDEGGPSAAGPGGVPLNQAAGDEEEAHDAAERERQALDQVWGVCAAGGPQARLTGHKLHKPLHKPCGALH